MSASFDQTIKIWNSFNFLNVYTLTDHTNFVTSVSSSFDSKYIISSGKDNKIKIWKALSIEE
jgi:WD40 repeat protein